MTSPSEKVKHVLMSDTYTCEACGGTFKSLRSDDEALEEAKRLHGDDLGETPAKICETCFHRLMES